MIRQPTGPLPALMPSRPDGEHHRTIVDRRRGTPSVPRHPAVTDDDFGGFTGDIVDEWGRQSFSASDPPANW